jgi:hypothetical protein
MQILKPVSRSRPAEHKKPEFRVSRSFAGGDGPDRPATGWKPRPFGPQRTMLNTYFQSQINTPLKISASGQTLSKLSSTPLGVAPAASYSLWIALFTTPSGGQPWMAGS